MKTATKKRQSRCQKKSSQAADIHANIKEQMSQPRSEKIVDFPILAEGATPHWAANVNEVQAPFLPPDTPLVSKLRHVKEEDACCDDDPPVLDRIVQSGQKVYENAEFVLEENVGPALKFTDRGGGLALTPIKLHNLGDDGDEMDDDSLKSICKVARPLNMCGLMVSQASSYIGVAAAFGLLLK